MPGKNAFSNYSQFHDFSSPFSTHGLLNIDNPSSICLLNGWGQKEMYLKTLQIFYTMFCIRLSNFENVINSKDLKS